MMNAVITGATRGIGRAIALKLAENHYNLAICARNERELEALADELRIYPVKVFTFRIDCSKKAEALIFFENVQQAMGKVDVLVNNVGVFLPGEMLDEPDESYELQVQLNLNATYYLSKNFGKMMREAQSGHIFNICSIASTEPVENAGSYAVTKAAMLSLNNVLRKELAVYRVKVTAILPGSTFTSSWEGTTIPNETFVQPEDIAQSLHSILNLSSGVNVDQLILTPLNFNN